MQCLVDIKGPTIEAPNGIPIAAGIQTDLICIACATNLDIKLVWNCQELRVLQHSNLITNSTEYISTLTFMPSSVNNGINCSCVLRAGKYFRSTSIQLVVTSAYFIFNNLQILFSRGYATHTCIDLCSRHNLPL